MKTKKWKSNILRNLLYCYKENIIDEKLLNYIELYKKIKNCQICKFTKKDIIFSDGKIQSNIMILLEPDEDKLSFNEEVSNLLIKMLQAIKLEPEKLYITSPFKCIQTSNETKETKLLELIENCRKILETEIQIINPRIILTLGDLSLKALFNNEASVDKFRGKLLYYKNIPVICTYHPSLLIKEPDFKKFAWNDLKFFSKNLNELN